MIKKSREELIGVYEKTVDTIKEGSYFTKEGEIEIKDETLKRKSRVYNQVRSLGSPKNPLGPTKIYVQNIDTFNKAKVMGPKVLVLNMASRRNPGGGVSGGSRAQEEELCRRSNLLKSLYAFSPNHYGVFGFKKLEGTYPIPSLGGIYTPGVTVFKDDKYNLLEEPFSCSVISVPGINRPNLDVSGNMIRAHVVMLKEKIRNLLRTAALEGHTKLVLGALGCGAFRCPSKHVAKIFKEVLGENEFNGWFEEICFAILEDLNSVRYGNEEGNVKPFAEIFGYEQ